MPFPSRPGPNLASPPASPTSTQASSLSLALRPWLSDVERWKLNADRWTLPVGHCLAALGRWPLGPHPLRPVLSLAGLATALAPFLVPANPAGLMVAQGTANAVSQGSHLQVNASANAVLHWQSFNIAPGERTTFVQPSASSIAWNHIDDPQPSAIFGRLDANGIVVLVNPAGFHFGPEAVVTAAGLVVSTAPVTPVESVAGLFWQFQGAPPSAAIVNYGRLEVGPGGSAFLIANRLENHGDIAAPGGTIGLHAGGEVLLSERPDGRGLSASVRLPQGSIDNSGRLVADAGTIALHARVVNQDGLVQADAIREHNGVIEFVASEALTLGPDSMTLARGDQAAGGDAGRIEARSGGTYADHATARLDVSAGPGHGRGGFVELSAPLLPAVTARLEGPGSGGQAGGRLLIDPTDIVIGNAGDPLPGSGSVGPGDPPDTLRLDVNTSFVGFSQITLQASRNLTLAAGAVWDLAASTGSEAPGSHLLLEAGNNLSLANGSALLAGQNWAVTLRAGRDFGVDDDATTPAPALVKSGVGTVSLAGNATIQTRNGDLAITAGNHVTVAGGALRTTEGGDITVTAVAGSIHTGTRPNGFQFRPSTYSVDPELGGISTAAGGNVSLTAGLDVTSYLPVPGGTQSDAGSGAFGAEPGNVSVTAGRDVSGHYVVRHGSGTLEAGRDAGIPTRLLALSLVDGSWSVSAGRDLLLQEIRNPNGVFNNLGSASSPGRQRFDYAPDAAATLRAGHSVQLRGTALPRYADAFSQGLPPLYPGTLDITAGAGGITLGNDVVLFPSPRGNLTLTTTDGGPLTGTKAGDLAQLILSDSAKTQYRAYGDFGIADHGPGLLHLDDPEPVRLAIAGDVSGILLGLPKRAEITVGGHFINSRLDGQNLHPDDVTRLQVEGDIRNRNEFTSVPLAVAPDFSAFALGLVYPPPTGGLVGLEDRFSYNPVTRSLTFQGRMTGDQLALLLATPVREFEATGAPVLLPNGEPATRIVQLLPPDVAQRLYDASQDIPLNPDTGYRLGGGGRFEISARSLDLGATAGIVSQGPRANPALARLFIRGADLSVTLDGDLDMFSTQIASLNGGAISLVAGGRIAAGSRDFTATTTAARGIYTVDRSDVTVIARGDIDINGSRIAAYDGGNVTVRSLEGNVDAGTGAGGSATVEKIHVDPVTREIRSDSPTIPGSGILATTFPPSLDPAFPPSRNTVGDILVETPRGDILASAGGVVQIPLNGVGTSAGQVTLRAGTRDADGNVLHAGNIDASGSGVIGSSVKLEASGNIEGLVFARENIDLSAARNVNVTALAQGNVNVSSAGNVSGTIIGVGSVTASGGGTVDAALLSQNVSASGNVSSSAQVGFGQGSAANATSQSVQSEEPAKTAAAGKESEDDEQRKARAATPAPRLTRTVGRVTVILPSPTR